MRPQTGVDWTGALLDDRYHYAMKPVTEWNEEYIRQLPRGEFDWIEFKGRRGLDFSINSINESKVLENLSVQIAAMANSGGGKPLSRIWNSMYATPMKTNSNRVPPSAPIRRGVWRPGGFACSCSK